MTPVHTFTTAPPGAEQFTSTSLPYVARMPLATCHSAALVCEMLSNNRDQCVVCHVTIM